MKKLKKIFLIFICFLLIFSFIQIPSSAIAVEIIGGGYAAYVILAAALAAAGYTVATNQVSPEIFQGILDSPNSELIKALIGGTTLYATTKGQVYFNWTSAQWSLFSDWVSNYISTGSFIIAGSSTTVPGTIIDGSEFVLSLPSSYLEKAIPTTNGVIGYYINSNTVMTVRTSGIYGICQLNFNNGNFTGSNNFKWYSNYTNAYLYGSPIYIVNGLPKLTIGIGRTSSNAVATITSQIDHIGEFCTNSLTSGSAYGHSLNFSYSNGHIIASGSNLNLTITGTSLFPYTYSSYIEWFTDCINTGYLVGDWSGIGEDVINPGRDIDVNIDAYPDYQVGEGDLSLPLDLDIGSSIDIPLDRWIDGPIDLSQDPVPIDFTDWPDRTIDTDPSDVVPDIRLNPPLDIPHNPDIPWADTESYPIDYPIDTDTPLLPDDPNPNTPPSGDDSNKMKLLPLILSKFPFCLPWDLQHGFKSLVVSGSPPVFDIPLRSVSAGINENIHIDLSRFQSVATVSRWFFSALWVVLLILITRKIVWK